MHVPFFFFEDAHVCSRCFFFPVAKAVRVPQKDANEHDGGDERMVMMLRMQWQNDGGWRGY